MFAQCPVVILINGKIHRHRILSIENELRGGKIIIEKGLPLVLGFCCISYPVWDIMRDGIVIRHNVKLKPTPHRGVFPSCPVSIIFFAKNKQSQTYTDGNYFVHLISEHS